MQECAVIVIPSKQKPYTLWFLVDPRYVTGQCQLPSYCYHLVWWWVYRPFDISYARWNLVTDMRTFRHTLQSPLEHG